MMINFSKKIVFVFPLILVRSFGFASDLAKLLKRAESFGRDGAQYVSGRLPMRDGVRGKKTDVTGEGQVTCKDGDDYKQNKYYVFDPNIPKNLTGPAKIILHDFKRLTPEPILAADPGAWDEGGWWEAGTVIWDEREEIFKMWYSGGVVSGTPVWPRYIAYATSRDGLRWEKPSLGLHLSLRKTSDNNICLIGAREPSVVFDTDAEDPTMRYKMWAMDGKRATHLYNSPDGINWEKTFGKPALPANPSTYITPTYPHEPNRELTPISEEAGDRIMVFHAKQRREYIAFKKLIFPGGPPYRRFARIASDDGINFDFENATWALTPGPEDADRDPMIEFYGLGFHEVHPRLYLMFPTLYHTADGHHSDVTVDISTDTIRWDRTHHKVLERGEIGQWDNGWTMGGFNLVEAKGYWWLYYLGTLYTHNDVRRTNFEKEPWGIGVSRMPEGRLASVSAETGKGIGVWEVGPISVGGRLFLNADVRGKIKITLIDADGKPIPGYKATIGLSNGIHTPVKFDKKFFPSVIWKKNATIRFELLDADLFGFEIVEGCLTW